MPRQSRYAKSTASLGFEAKLGLTADNLRNNMDAAEYKHVVHGLIYVKYISDTFEEHRGRVRVFPHPLPQRRGQDKGKFYTPSCVVRCLVEMLAPHKIVNPQIVLAAPSTDSRQ